MVQMSGALFCLFAAVWGAAHAAPLEYDSSFSLARVPTEVVANADDPKTAKMLPLVFWHGMGDSCCDPNRGLGSLIAELESEYGVFVYSIGFGSESEDIKAGYFGNVNEQVAEACEKLAKVEELKDGFDAVGFSQGGQFLRAVVERCHHKLPKIRNLISIGGQHQGVMSVPSCLPGSGFLCKWMAYLANKGAYLSWPSTHIIQAQYVKDPNNLEGYLEHNIFLPYINNEKDANPLYAKNLAALDAFIMFRFSDDTMVVPRDSAWFSFYDGKKLIEIRDQPIYKEDWIGLKQLDDKGGLLFDELSSKHMQFTWEMFRAGVVEKYLLKSV
ncbi:hypothetical protein BSKO_08259 [Bryopsis sp. KO-2023]|nr:hypothetical protein BSKO_08259 [Bryopsis sp. KO-2023]